MYHVGYVPPSLAFPNFVNLLLKEFVTANWGKALQIKIDW